MASKNQTSQRSKDTKDSEEDMLDILAKESRFMIILYLLSYPELGLGELSKRIGKSKSTIHRDLKILQKHGIVYEIRQDYSTKSKYYALNPKFIFEDLRNLQSPESIERMSEEQRRKLFEFLMESTKKAFYILDNSINLTIKYLDYFEDLKKNLPIPDLDTFTMWGRELDLGIRVIPLSDKTYPIYGKHFARFSQELNKELYDIHKKEEEMGGEYLVWHVVLPLRKILR